MKKNLIILFFGVIAGLISIQSLNAQNASMRNIRGQIVDDGNDPVVGATIKVVDSPEGTTTNAQGFFELKIPTDKKMLAVSFVGYKTEQVVLTQSSFYDIKLKTKDIKAEEIVVEGFPDTDTRARRRRENLQKVPETVTMLSGQQIATLGVHNLESFIAYVPNVSFFESQNVGNNNLNIRGMYQLRNGESPAAFVIDGVFMPDPNSISLELLNIESMELLRGPQGSLYGKNAIAGAINITTKKPTYEYKNFIDLGYEMGNQFSARFSSLGPIVGDLFYTFSGSVKKRDGLIKNEGYDASLNYPNNNQMVDWLNDYSFSGSLIGRFLPELTLTFSAAYSRTLAGATYWSVIPGTGAAVKVATTNYANIIAQPNMDYIGTGTRDYLTTSLKLDYSVPVGSLEVALAYYSTNREHKGDLDMMPMSLLLQYQNIQNNIYQAEVRFTSNDIEHFHFGAGGFFTNVQRQNNLRVPLNGPMLTALFTGGNPSTVTASQASMPYDARYNSYFSFGGNEFQNNFTAAGFAYLRYTILEQLELNAGVRVDYNIINTTLTTFDATKGTLLAASPLSNKTELVTQPKASISYNFLNKSITDKSAMIYATYGIGYRSGGFNNIASANAGVYPLQYEPEISNNVELGFKSEWFNKRLIISVSGFYNLFSNQQNYILNLNKNSGQIILNLAQSYSAGCELELKARIVEGLDLDVSGGFTQAMITQFNDYYLKLDATITNTTTTKFTPFVPNFTFNGGLQYMIRFADDWMFRIRGNVQAVGKTYWGANNSDFRDPYVMLGFRGSLGYKNVALTLRVENVLNSRFYTEYFPVAYSGALAGDLGWLNQPLRMGVDLSFAF